MEANGAEHSKEAGEGEYQFTAEYPKEQFEKDASTVALLEDHVSSPEFTNFLQEFIDKYAESFEEKEEHDLEYYEIYKEYVKMIEGQLEKFLAANGLEEEAVFASCSRVQEMDAQCLSCIDYLVASSEYTEFIQMMLQYKHARNWVCETDFMKPFENGTKQ